MLYPVIARIAVVAYRDADWIVCKPDALFVIHIKVGDVVAVHFVVLVVVGYDVWSGLIRVYIYLIYSCTVCCNKQFLIVQWLYACDADGCQAHSGLGTSFGVHVIDIYAAFESTDE